MVAGVQVYLLSSGPLQVSSVSPAFASWTTPAPCVHLPSPTRRSWTWSCESPVTWGGRSLWGQWEQPPLPQDLCGLLRREASPGTPVMRTAPAYGWRQLAERVLSRKRYCSNGSKKRWAGPSYRIPAPNSGEQKAEGVGAWEA